MRQSRFFPENAVETRPVMPQYGSRPASKTRGLLACLWLVAATTPMAQAVVADDPFLRRTPTVHAIEKVGPAVVSITTEQVVQQPNPFNTQSANPYLRRYFKDLFEPLAPRTTNNLGSGILISEEGHILTNEHVVEGASRISIQLADGRTFDAEVIGADPTNDIAVLQTSTDQPLPWVSPGFSSDIMVGEPVIAIGNPFGLSNTVTTGVISATNRSIRAHDRTFHGFLQTDASINQGNSGGPLLNAEGSLIGVNTAIYSGAEGIGFAIPIDVAKRVVGELIEHGEVLPVTVGIAFQDLSPALREVMGLPGDVGGVLINRVHEDGPADRAGLLRGDVLTRLDDRKLNSARQLFEILETVTPGQALTLTVWREEAFLDVEIHAQEIPDNVGEELAKRLLGTALAARSDGFFRVSQVRQGSPSQRMGIKPGDLLLAVNGIALNNPQALRQSMLGLRGRDRALVVIQRGSGRYHLTIPTH